MSTWEAQRSTPGSAWCAGKKFGVGCRHWLPRRDSESAKSWSTLGVLLRQLNSSVRPRRKGTVATGAAKELASTLNIKAILLKQLLIIKYLAKIEYLMQRSKFQVMRWKQEHKASLSRSCCMLDWINVLTLLWSSLKNAYEFIFFVLQTMSSELIFRHDDCRTPVELCLKNAWFTRGAACRCVFSHELEAEKTLLTAAADSKWRHGWSVHSWERVCQEC